MRFSQEAHLGFAALAIRATSDFAAVLKHAGQAEQAANYTATAMRLAKELRARPSTTGRGEEWYTDYGADGNPLFLSHLYINPDHFTKTGSGQP